MLIPPPSTPWSSKDNHLADWTVVVNSERAFQVNSTALASNSRFFYDSFTAQVSHSGARKGRLSRVTRLDYPDLNAVKELLGFISKFPSTNESLPKDELIDLLSTNRLKARLQAARYFGVPRLIDCIVSAAARYLTHSTCWEVMAIAADPECANHLVEFIAKEYALRHFHTAAEQPQFNSLVTYYQLCALLDSNYLNAPDEFQLVDLIAQWVETDEEARLRHFPSLLSRLRLGRLTSAQLDRLAAHRLVAKTSTTSGRILSAAISATFSWTHLLEAGVQQQQQQQNHRAPVPYQLRPRIPHQAIFLCGGWEGNLQESTLAPSSAVQLFDHVTMSWIRHDTFLPAQDTRHAYSACVELDNVVYLIGGYVQPRVEAEALELHGPTARVRAYYLKQNVWRERAPMHDARNFVSACRCSRRLYAMGGHNGQRRLASVEAYDPRENRWVSVAPMLHVRSDACASELGGRIYICGGFSGTTFLNSAERYDPDTDQWTMLAPMATGRSGLSICAFGRYIYAMGGNSGIQRLASVERYDPTANTWSEAAPMVTQRSNFCSTVLHSCLYAIGGWSDQTRATVRSVERCQLDGAWESGTRLELANSACSCCTISDCYLIEPLVSQRQYYS